LRGILEHKDVNFWGKIVGGASGNQEFFVHGSDCVGKADRKPDLSAFKWQIKKGCELRFKSVLKVVKGRNKLQAKEVTHYLCPNCPDTGQPPPPPKNNPPESEKDPLPVGQAIKKKQEKKESKKPSQQPKADRKPKKRKKRGVRLGTTRAGPRKRKKD
tara:strand:- start:16 stop:489 length:474 start_codon:yes stop_codon:yes gene_type:complete